jgi:hopene-associated glycosyltransferase HpnB
MTPAVVLASLALLIWLYLVFLHGGFWLGHENDDMPLSTSAARQQLWPHVAAVVPARNEADMIPLSLPSLLAQDYPGMFSIILVDDQSDDGTGEIARNLAQSSARAVTIITGEARPLDWTGKVWAQHQGIAHANALDPKPDYLLLTDADIGYAPDALTRLVTRALAGNLVLTSLMAKLKCESFAERALIPAFIFFFQMLYPFRWVNRPGFSIAGAAGGCMLVDRAALEKAGGIGIIKSALIDDCSLAKVMKFHGPIWLGLTEHVHSLRPYPHVEDIRRMVARSAYAQLRYSPILLAGTVAGLCVTYLAAPLIAAFGPFPANLIALLAFGLMALSFQPTLKLYDRSALWGLALPLIALAYLAFTLDSAYQHARGRGGMWKGRAQALSSSKPERE